MHTTMLPLAAPDAPPTLHACIPWPPPLPPQVGDVLACTVEQARQAAAAADAAAQMARVFEVRRRRGGQWRGGRGGSAGGSAEETGSTAVAQKSR